jgi:uncharacterized protein (TIGR03118 family)
VQTNLVSDVPGLAAHTDPNLRNPWGTSTGPGLPIWVSDNAAGATTLYDGAGNPQPGTKNQLVVSIPAPPAAGPGAAGSPTGTVFNPTTDGFVVSKGGASGPSRFLFATEDGLIAGWNPNVDRTHAVIAVDRSNVLDTSGAVGAVYKGLALVTTQVGTFLYATNFRFGTVEVFDSHFNLVKTFTDARVPAGFAPFGIHNIGGNLFVTFAEQDAAKHDDVAGAGHGFVDEFSPNGDLVQRLVTGGKLDSPWAVTMAPPAFGAFGGDILIGNFGDGVINAYDPKTFAFLGQLSDGTGKTLVYASLWEIFFGLTAATATAPTNTNTLYFTAGLAGEKHGLLGAINTNPTATGTPTYGFSASAAGATVTAGSSATFVLSAAPTNNFSGTVALACGLLPEAATCTFSPASLNVTAGAPATSTLTIATVKKTALLQPRTIHGVTRAGITAAFLLPFGAILASFRWHSSTRRPSLRLFALLGILLVSAGFLQGCSSSSDVIPPSTPAGMTAITIKATSGSITQSTVVNLTVQ